MNNKAVYISKGNKKVMCPIYNNPAIVTCKPNLACHKYCYACKAERLYPSVKPCRMNNYNLSKTDQFVNLMVDQIGKMKTKYFRIHESGDFYSVEYIQRWYIIIKKFPSIQFYAYTKRDDLFNELVLKEKPSNLILILSLDGIQDGKQNYSIPKGFNKLAITHKTKTNCPALLKDGVKCMKNCFRCATKKSEIIIFKKH